MVGSSRLIFLHTSPVHVPTFDRLLATVQSDVASCHIVAEGLLAEARQTGLTAVLQAKIIHTLTQAVAAETAVCLCTCSTIGAYAEQVSQQYPHIKVLRVDRPMAQKAVATGDRIVVMATLSSTIEPTKALLLEEAAVVGKDVALIEVVCPTAWDYFEAGDQAGYVQLVVTELRRWADKGDVVVLAQASMAAAAELCPEITVPILSSPRLGVEAALLLCRDG